MKLFLLFLLVLAHTTNSFADSYQFTATDADLGKVIVVKNCLDYHFCGVTSTSLAGGKPEFRFHTFIELSDADFQTALSACDFQNIGVQVSIQNMTKNTMVPLTNFNSGLFFKVGVPTLDVGDRYNSEQLLAKYNKVKDLLSQKQNQLALDTVLSEYDFPSGGYTLKIGKDVAVAGAITNHQTKTVTMTEAAFVNACTLLQMTRHELEHVAQYNKLNSCKSGGQTHNFIDHLARERSAYLNDMRNLPILCRDQTVIGSFTQFLENTFFKNYSTAH